MAAHGLAHKLTAKNEGGYANDEADKGGETIRGIARKHNPLWLGWKIVDAAVLKLGKVTLGDGKKAEVRAVWKEIDLLLKGNAPLEELVGELYKAKYWDPLHLDEEPDQGLANMIYDKAVLMGVGPAKAIYAEAKKHA